MVASISIVLPVYNQAGHIEQITTDYIQALRDVNFDYEILLVVNNSRDGSAGLCQEMEDKYPQVRAMNLKAGGWGLAVKAGLRAAQGDLLCYTNSARTSPQDLALLLLYGNINADKVIKANRKIRESTFRRMGSLLYNLECRALFDLPYWDINGTPKVFPRACDRLLDLTREDDLIDLEFAVVCRENGYPLIEVPIFSSRRHSGRSTTSMKSAIHMYLNAYLMWAESRKGSR